MNEKGNMYNEHSNIHHHRSLKIINLHGGEVHASKEPVRIQTLLGSCVATCLFDPTTYIGGMNHFLLPGKTHDAELSARYGGNAMEMLISKMVKLGANRYELCAKIFGGGDVLHSKHSSATIGRTNINFVKEFLATEQIPILAHHVGGNHGLIIYLLTNTFDVYIRKIHMEKFNRIHAKEVIYQTRFIDTMNTNSSGNIALF
jgi:chemotaxis protein CheD